MQEAVSFQELEQSAMSPTRPILLSAAILATGLASVAAQAQDDAKWLTRCRDEIADDEDRESADYYLETRGETDDGNGRAYFSYSRSGVAHETEYMTEATGFMNPYGGASFGVGYYANVEDQEAGKPSVGRVSFSASTKGFERLDGEITVGISIDGETFGPYSPKPSTIGQYSIWLDTEDTDGDNAEPILNRRDFDKIAKAIEGVELAEVSIFQDGKQVAVLPVRIETLQEWRDGLASWGTRNGKSVADYGGCAVGRKVN
jgi:hypothetical protein